VNMRHVRPKLLVQVPMDLCVRWVHKRAVTTGCNVRGAATCEKLIEMALPYKATKAAFDIYNATVESLDASQDVAKLETWKDAFTKKLHSPIAGRRGGKRHVVQEACRAVTKSVDSILSSGTPLTLLQANHIVETQAVCRGLFTLGKGLSVISMGQGCDDDLGATEKLGQIDHPAESQMLMVALAIESSSFWQATLDALTAVAACFKLNVPSVREQLALLDELNFKEGSMESLSAGIEICKSVLEKCRRFTATFDDGVDKPIHDELLGKML
jgi:hypothetical protein